MLAEGMLSAFREGCRKLNDRMDAIERYFGICGVSLDMPYLNPGSPHTYSFPHLTLAAPVSRKISRMGCDDWMDVAASMSLRLADKAIWWEDRCTWIGSVPANWNAISGGLVEDSTLGLDLYSGLAGIALLFGELHSATGERRFRAISLAAMRQALWLAALPEQNSYAGLYTGWTGVALAAARLGHLLSADELLDSSCRLLDAGGPSLRQTREFDVLSGDAGIILALLALRRLLKNDALLRLAQIQAKKLILAADHSGDTCSWASPGIRSTANLTGLSHGAAGAALALLELDHEIHRPAYRAIAFNALNYETIQFDPKSRNWRDFRLAPGEAKGRRRKPSVCSHWCHGAPGIALSRIRIGHLVSNRRYTFEGELALETTRAAIQSVIGTERVNYSLCHGLAGNAEIYGYGSTLLGTRNNWELAFEVAHKGARLNSSGGSWPCGIAGEPPSLMLGLAGIAYFYLRLARPHIPSMLLLTPEEFSRL
jgi:lantibiotic modifying enzyme